MARTRIIRPLFEKIDPKRAQREARERQALEKRLANMEKQRAEAEQRRAEKEAKRLEEKRLLVQQKIQKAIANGEITEEEAAQLPELDEYAMVRWAHIPYINHVLQLRTKIDNNEWEKVCLYVADKKDFNPVFADTVKNLFSDAYQFEPHVPHASPYRKWYKKKNTETDAPAVEQANKEPWANTLYDACAPHWVVSKQTDDATHKFGIMTLWRSRFTKHGLSLMARSQFIKAKLFEQETGIPVFMIFGVGGTAQETERLFIIPFSEVENHFVPKPIAWKYEVDPHLPLHFIPEQNKLIQ